MSETAREAWFRVYGTPFDTNNDACIHFGVGFMAARQDA